MMPQKMHQFPSVQVFCGFGLVPLHVQRGNFLTNFLEIGEGRRMKAEKNCHKAWNPTFAQTCPKYDHTIQSPIIYAL